MSDLGAVYRVDELIRQSADERADPFSVMRVLRYGAALDNANTSLPAAPRSRRWLRFDAVPARDAGRVGEIEEILLASIGAHATIEVVAQNTGTGTGLDLLIGFADESDLRAASALIAPRADWTPVAGPARVDGPHRAGIVHRLEAHDGAEDDDRDGIPLLGRLASIAGPWQVTWRLQGAGNAQIDELTDEVERLEDSASARTSVTIQTGPTTTVTADLAAWGRVVDWLSVLRRQLTGGRSAGLWSVETQVVTATPGGFDAICSSFRHGFRSRVQQVFATGVYASAAGGFPPVSVLTTEQLGRLLDAPPVSVPGLRIRAAASGGRVSTGRGAPIELGTGWGTDEPITIDVDDLVGHAFVTGTTGSGKTTTVTRLLSGLWNDHRVPFLIVDPVKNDYAAAAAAFNGGLNVVRGADLRLDALRAWPGEAPAFHIARVSQAFRGAFTMPTPVPYVVAQLFDQLVEQESGPEDTSLFDLRAAVDPLVSALGYAPEVESNIRAALLTRLNLLLTPAKAQRFSWPDSSALTGLFDRPTVVTLADLGDDEERSFAVLLLALAAWQSARARTGRARVAHVLVLEEAHRVIPELGPARGAAGEVSSGSALAESAALLTSLLSEVRSYGEQVIVLDQSPARVSQEVVRNTNLKIVHRLLHPDDQAQAGGSLGLDAEQARSIGGLLTGQALISSGAAPEAQAVRIASANAVGGTVHVPAAATSPWPCCVGEAGEAVHRHYRAWQLSRAAEAAVALAIVGVRAGDGDGDALRRQTYDALGLVAAEGAGLSRSCLAWVGIRSVLVRERAASRIPSAARFRVALETTFGCWADKSPLTKAMGATRRVPTSAAPCPVCGERCRVRIPASILYSSQPIGGLRSTWRRAGDDLDPVITWVAAEAVALRDLLGAPATWELLRCMVAHAVLDGRLPRPLIDHVITAARART